MCTSSLVGPPSLRGVELSVLEVRRHDYGCKKPVDIVIVASVVNDINGRTLGKEEQDFCFETKTNLRDRKNVKVIITGS